MEIILYIFAVIGLISLPLAIYFYYHPRGLTEAETKIALLEQEIINEKQKAEEKIKDWELTKEESMKAAKAAMFDSGKEVFKEEAKELGEHFVKVKESVAILHSKVTKHGEVVDTVWKNLTSPTEAGKFSEIGLENTLKNYGLEAGRDFISQFTTSDAESGSTLRPDAVVFMPGDNLLVIDSKASKFFLELAAANAEEEQILQKKLIRTMRDHVSVLASKGYKDAVKNMYKKSEQVNDPKNIFTVMFLQTESNLEKLYQIDPEFKSVCEKFNIIPSGPTGLSGLLSLAKMEISRDRRDKESENIINELKAMFGSLETALNFAAGVGRSLSTAAKNYQKFTNSINSNLLPKARRINKMGVELPKNKKVPDNLTSYHFYEAENVIEGSAESVEEEVEQKLKQLEDA